MSLLTEHRPATFDEVIGHKSVIQSLKKALAKDNRPHAWLFTGASGVGKTTLARIIAGQLGAKGMGIIEINIANLRGIDAIREMAVGVQYKQPGSASSVYILDEVHQMTTDAQNALLKILEDPPAHAYFILCTTETGKLLPTIRTRVIEYKLDPVGVDDIAELLVSVVQKEKIEGDVTEEIIAAICERCLGSPRLALNLLEKCSGAAGDIIEALKLMEGAVQDFDMAGPVDQVKRVLSMLTSTNPAEREWREVSKYVQDRLMKKVKPDEFKAAFIGVVGRMLLSTPQDWMAQAVIMAEDSLRGANTDGGLIAFLYQVQRIAVNATASRPGNIPSAGRSRFNRPESDSGIM
jgi:DNA polymerase III gamma/tau subunit